MRGNLALFGLKPWAFHALNAVVHAINATLLYFIARRVLSDDTHSTAPLAAGVLFAAHPICSEAVLWASGVPELTFTLFSLASLLFFLQGRYALSGMVFFLSFLSKETAIALPLIMASYDFASSRRTGWTRRYRPFAAAMVAYFALRLNALGSFAPEDVRYPMAAGGYIMTACALMADYIKLLVFPVGLNILHTFRPVAEIGSREVVAIAIVALFSVAFVYSFVSRRARDLKIPLFLVWILLPILPVLFTFQVREFPFSERYLYLPAAGLALLIGTMLGRISGGKRAGLVVFIIIAVLYSLGTLGRIPDWKNNFTLWSDAAQKAPDNFYTRYSLGVEYMARGENEAAAVELAEAARLKPDYFNAPYNLGLVYFKLGQLNESIAANIAAAKIAKTPSDEALARVNTGNALAKSGRLVEAVDEYQRALEADPVNQTALRNMGVVTGMMRRQDALTPTE
jgi:hypothetical protein